MEWVEKFYDQQYKWMDLNDEEMLNMQQELLQKLERLADQPGKKILELGGGKGYFAVAAAKQGYKVTVIELVDEAARYIRQLAEEQNVSERLTVISGDFYTAEIPDVFDIVCYWDGFGIGSDADQQKLLNRIQDWLKPGGIALIDVYTPWFWAKAAGREMRIAENVVRKYGFDAMGCRMLDTWRNEEDAAEQATQSLRCYSPADFSLLIRNLDLTIVHCEPGGAMDYESGVYTEEAPLHEALSYLVKLKVNG
ncbi:SAM-dependent methyltransferase [Planococcus sp. CAU13]|uniref:SAM-dependent methyltransferase n=1 Tax=Planococcus sp. CAU13 TaxID=1541197 RepID=UPI000530099A|nr:class I SAM-dependent methyltransferase [Planococcus sp. CAU13]